MIPHLARSAALAFAMTTLLGCSSATTPGGGSSAECTQIEADYKAAATGATALTCTTSADCELDSGLCKPDGTRVTGNAKGTYGKATVTKLKSLNEQWNLKNCNEDKSCSVSTGGMIITCEANACKVQ